MSLTVSIITPERALPEQSADHVTLPAFDGEVGIRTGHAAFVCLLGKGSLHIKQGDRDQVYKVQGGVAQVDNNVVRVLAQSVTAL